MARFLALGTVVSCFAMFGCSAAAPTGGEPSTESEPPAVGVSQQQQPLGVFLFEVDPSLPADQMVKISDITATTRPLTKPGSVAQAVSDVTTAVYVYNNTTPTWDATNKWTDVQFGVQNLSTTNYLDEPYLQITSITATGGTITFAETGSMIAGHSFIASSSGTNYGQYYLADAWTKCSPSCSGSPGNHKDTALQYMRIKDPSGVKYSFTAAVYANTNTTGSGIYPDGDQDTYNGEPYAQLAGGDCNDSASATIAATTCGSAGCATTCASSSGAACPSSGTSTGCCGDTTSTGMEYCPAGCSCSSTFAGNYTATGIDCKSGSTCNTSYPAGATPAAPVMCESGATCVVDCTNESSTLPFWCAVDCVSGSNCTLICPAGKHRIDGADTFCGWFGGGCFVASYCG